MAKSKPGQWSKLHDEDHRVYAAFRAAKVSNGGRPGDPLQQLHCTEQGAVDVLLSVGYTEHRKPVKGWADGRYLSSPCKRFRAYVVGNDKRERADVDIYDPKHDDN